MVSLSRADVAEWSSLSPSQLEYLTKAGVITADVGDQRKRFSANEARLAVIAGAAIANGIKPQALVAPIGWLREYVSWPAIDLPDNPADVDIELLAETFRGADDFALGKRRDILAAKIFSGARPDDFENALASNDETSKRRAGACVERARCLLDQPKKWSLETVRKIRAANDFEKACRGSMDLFFHVSTGDDSWSTFVSESVSRVENETVWLVIDIRRLFSQRRPLL